MARFIEVESERLDRFELLAELASGGMATVFLARLHGAAGFQRLVAVKRLHPHLAREQEFVDMFLDEARLASRLRHPNVVPIQEVGQSARGYYLVMDYVEGDTFARFLTKGAADGQRLVRPAVSIRVVLDLLRGLAAAHDLEDDEGKPLELVHRDVSPQNVLLGIDGASKLTDFGVARAAARLSTTRSGKLKGKLSYMAPEQARGEIVDRRADIFAAGVVLWEALAMRRLFRGEGEADVLNKILHQTIPGLRTVVPTIPALVEAACMKALEREKEQRYQTATEFADALERAAMSRGLLATHQDVAANLDLVLGSEVREHRELVRTWLSRPEGNFVARPADSVTRVESSHGRTPSPGSSASLPELSSRVSIPAGEPAHATQTSGGLQVGLSSPPPRPPGARRWRVATALFAAIALLATAGLAFRETRSAGALLASTPRTITSSRSGRSASAGAVTAVAATASPTATTVRKGGPPVGVGRTRAQSGTGEDLRNPYR